jgi:microcystin-dependent protein
MSDPFIAEIRIFGGNFAPRGWATCDGQVMAIAQNTALFSLLGVTYGGDGRVTFALPNLAGRAPMAAGSGPGLTPRELGEMSGSNSVTLIQTELPVHNHTLNGFGGFPDAAAPSTAVGVGSFSQSIYGSGALVLMNPGSLTPAGSSLPHNNMQPYLGLTFIIALYGIFPPRG